MIVVSGHIRVKPEAVAGLKPHMRTVLETTRQERGCLLYAYGEDVLDPGLIRIVERWESRETLDAHSRAPHIKAWGEALSAAGGTLERDIWAHEAGDGRRI